MKNLIKKFFFLGMLSFCVVASAEEPVEMITDHNPSAVELDNLLFGRSIPIVGQLPPAVGLLINFEVGENTISPDSFETIKGLGELLVKKQDKLLRIEGHTDASGSAKKNIRLSKQRAASIKKYLVENFDISSNRLIAVGLGAKQPLAGVDPYDGKNRRVQFREQK